MKMSIDWESKELHVTCADIVEAGWFGFDFARDNRDLVDAKWVVCYYSAQSENSWDEMPVEDCQLIDSCESNIGDILRKGQTPNHCNTCTCSPEGGV